jgi:type 1 glutamine amidotransferase/nicotinamidase-related amidase
MQLMQPTRRWQGTRATFGLGLFLVATCVAATSLASDTWQLTLRCRVEKQPEEGRDELVETKETWLSRDTAVIVCDMWDVHHCFRATGRVAELAPRINQVLHAARDQGALIVHAPSSCMGFYKDHPARKRAQRAPQAANLPPDIGKWCKWKDDREQQEGYPIDHSDGGEDDTPEEHAKWHARLKQMGRDPKVPWVRQIDALEIDLQRDAISDSGTEVWNLLQQHGIKNVILVGVHTNMCVLGRPFGLRRMARNGLHVVLMRDLTDTMYNPARPPHVSHFRGTDLVVAHVEQLVCPTITSDQLIGGHPFRFLDDRRPRIVIAIAEPEYETHRTLPAFARQCWVQRHEYPVRVIEGDARQHQIPGFAEAVDNADVIVLSIRRQALPAEDLAALRAQLQAGKSLIGIRTTCHAFDARGQGPPGHAEWPGFDHEVLGGNYHNHHGSGPTTTVTRAAGVEHSILRGIPGNFTSQGSLYKVSPLTPSTHVLLMGTIPGQPPEPVAWTHRYGPRRARIFFTSLGHKSDFDKPQFRRLLDNAMSWATDRKRENRERKQRRERP